MTAKSPETATTRPVIALYPGSFDPFTIGHLSVLQRALPMFERVVVVVGVNDSKPGATPAEARVEEIRTAIAGMQGVEVMAWNGLTVDLANELGARYMIRGVRTAADFDYEYTLATVNRQIADIETVFIPALPQHAAVSSSVVRELKRYGRDVSQFLP